MVAVTSMVGSDMLFMSMSSHITLLQRLLQLKVRNLGMSSNVCSGPVDCYAETISAIKIHQRLIRYIFNSKFWKYTKIEFEINVVLYIFLSLLNVLYRMLYFRLMIVVKNNIVKKKHLGKGSQNSLKEFKPLNRLGITLVT